MIRNNQNIIEIMNQFESYFASFVTVLVVASTLVLINKIRNETESDNLSTRKEIPSPKGSYPFIGHLRIPSKNFKTSIVQLHKELGPIFHLKIGTQNWVFLADPEAVHEVLVINQESTSGRFRSTFFSGFVSPEQRGVLFTDYNKKWKTSRELLLKLLSHQSVDSLSSLFILESQKLVDTIAKTGDELDPACFTFLAGLNVMNATVFGLPSIENIEEPDLWLIQNVISKTMKLGKPSKDLYSTFPYLSFLDFFLKRKKTMNDFVRDELRPMMARFIQRSRENGKDCFVKKFDSVKDLYLLDELDLISLLTELMLTGVQPISFSLSWALMILCHHPDIQHKLQEEIDCFMTKQGRLPSFEEQHKLPYLSAFGKECLRFRPPADFITPHKVSKDDYLIPKGSLVSVNIHTLHHDSDIYQNPKEFQPERFLNDSRTLHDTSHGPVSMRNHFAFGWGKRICPGIYWTEAHMFYVVSKIMSVFSLMPALSASGQEVYPDLDEFDDNGIIVGPGSNKMRFVLREKQKGSF